MCFTRPGHDPDSVSYSAQAKGGPPTLLPLHAVHGEEVDDPGREVQCDVLLVLLDGQTVAVSVARPGHPTTVQKHGRPGERARERA